MLDGHSARVGALAWNGDCISSGSRDRLIFQRDIRQSSTVPGKKLEGHRQEVKSRLGSNASQNGSAMFFPFKVCGLKWSPDNSYLASGGNDNKLFIWNLSSSGSAHSAAAIPRLLNSTNNFMTS